MTLERRPPPILRDAHGEARDGGAVLVAEHVGLRDLSPPNAARTESALALRRVRGRPFQPGNAAASGRGPSLTRVTAAAAAPEPSRRARRKAASLVGKRRVELEVQTGGPVSSAVKVELVAWASATAAADQLEREGADPLKVAALREKASGHGLKALGLAEREAAARPRAPVDPMARIRAMAAGAPQTNAPDGAKKEP